jgi:hypothetical protein
MIETFPDFKSLAPEIARLTRSRLIFELLMFSPLFLFSFAPLFVDMQKPAVIGLPLIGAGAMAAVIFKYKNSKKGIVVYLSSPNIPGKVIFKSSLVGKFTTTFVDIECENFTGSRHCAYLNVKGSQLREVLDAYIFFYKDKPKLILTTDLKTFCLLG